MEEQKPKENLSYDFIENFTKEWNEVTAKFKEYYKREKETPEERIKRNVKYSAGRTFGL